MPSTDANQGSCQVDFYLLKEATVEAPQFACRLALMAWEQGHRIFVVSASREDTLKLDELMWQHPPGRFLPHSTSADEQADRAAVIIGELSGLKRADVVINLCPEPVPEPARFGRVLEIVPFDTSEREASRIKYKDYRDLGLTPSTHETSG